MFKYLILINPFIVVKQETAYKTITVSKDLPSNNSCGTAKILLDSLYRALFFFDQITVIANWISTSKCHGVNRLKLANQLRAEAF